ncbi:MAG: N-acetylglucosaminyltransferase [Rivularia sp. ALOHA_DT_140]|nr:N-acetylglucosaminyltransferase [Rivularia sp. ALOHA_DT_140]
MKVCYLIMSHKNPEQIYRLIHTIKTYSPNSYILLRHNPIYCKLDISKLTKYSGIDIQFVTAERGNFSLLANYISAINWILKNNLDFDWFINLSAQDYPTQSLEKLEILLSTTQYDGFLLFFKVFSPESHWNFKESCDRYLYRYRNLVLPSWIKSILKIIKVVNYLQPFFRINFSYGLKFGTRAKPIFNHNFSCYGGAFFSILSKNCIQYLHDFYQNNPHIVEYYKHVLLPDESFIQTILVNSKKFNLKNECKTYSDFHHSSHGHPEILTENYYHLIKQDKYYFARKFDTKINSKILDALDQDIFTKSIEAI